MFSIRSPHMHILAGESRPDYMIHLRITLPNSNENHKIKVIYHHMGLHQYRNHLEVDIIEQERPGFEPLESKPTALTLSDHTSVKCYHICFCETHKINDLNNISTAI